MSFKPEKLIYSLRFIAENERAVETSENEILELALYVAWIEVRHEKMFFLGVILYWM